MADKERTVFKAKKQWFISLVSALGLALVIGGVSLFAGPSVANATEQTANDLRTLTQSTTGPGLLGEGYLAHGGWGRGEIDYQQLLADALGIDIEELQAAYEAARTAAIEQAVARGLITREQADEMLVWGGWERKGAGFFGFRRGPEGLSGEAIDEQALLAAVLDISVEDLQAAREAANQAAIEQAVAEGIITQEQVDQMQARRDLQGYLNRDALLAAALGMTVEDLQAAYAEGQTLSELLEKRGLDAVTVRQNLQTARDEAIARAVADEVITQQQADEMQAAPGAGFGMDGMPGPGGRGGFHGHGGFKGQRPFAPDGEDSGGAGFRFPGRPLQGDSTL